MCIPKGACHGCLWRGPARALHIQRQMLEANHWTGCGVPNGGPGGWSGGAEGIYSPMGRTMISATQMPQDAQGLNQGAHMVPAKNVAEEDLVGHQWEEKSLVR